MEDGTEEVSICVYAGMYAWIGLGVHGSELWMEEGYGRTVQRALGREASELGDVNEHRHCDVEVAQACPGSWILRGKTGRQVQ